MGGSPESDEIHARGMMARIAHAQGKTLLQLESEQFLEELHEQAEARNNKARIKNALKYLKSAKKFNRKERDVVIAILEGTHPGSDVDDDEERLDKEFADDLKKSLETIDKE